MTSPDDLTERILLLEKAANQLESDNRDLAAKLREALNQNELLQSSHKHDLQRLKSANTRLQEQVERHKSYGETLEKEIESLQSKVKDQSQRLQEGSQVKENEILSLKTDLSRLKLEYEQKVESLEERLRQSQAESRLESEKVNASVDSGRIGFLETERDELKSRVLQLETELKTTKIEKSESEASGRQTTVSVIESLRGRETQLQNDNYNLRQKIIELETRINQQLSENLSLKHQVDDVSSRNQTLLVKVSSLQAERETLELELRAAMEKLAYLVKRHQDKKSKLHSKILNHRMVFDGEVGKYKEKISELERDIRQLSESVRQSDKQRLDMERRHSTLVTENRSNISKLVDLEDDVRERNRCITLLQTKLHYTQKENNDLTNLCNKLKQLSHPLLSAAPLASA